MLLLMSSQTYRWKEQKRAHLSTYIPSASEPSENTKGRSRSGCTCDPAGTALRRFNYKAPPGGASPIGMNMQCHLEELWLQVNTFHFLIIDSSANQ